ncbi:MAG: ROK family protein [Saprospiraceae bacterium]
MKNIPTTFNVLSIDIGGSHIKATVLNEDGKELEAYKSEETPNPASPEKVLEAIKKLVANFDAYNYVSVGFPGFIKGGIIQTAPNLGTKMWHGFDLEKRLGKLLGKPTKVVNDADLQGIGVVDGKGFEILVTLGTGFGTAFLKNGELFPHIELAHHPVTKKKDYDKYVGEKALKKKGVKKWNKRMKKVISILKIVFNYDQLYISGGNAQAIKFTLDENIKIVTNEDGIKGGAMLWKK